MSEDGRLASLQGRPLRGRDVTVTSPYENRRLEMPGSSGGG
jgi:hypothetical protein